MNIRWQLLLGFILFINGCGDPSSSSRLAASREARALLHTPIELPASFWNGIDRTRLSQDFLEQRQTAWNFWSQMLGNQSFMVWQTWYSREDLQRIFLHLYQNLGPALRLQRQVFPAAQVEAALLWNNQGQFEQSDWDQNRFMKWLSAFDSDEKKRSIPGMQKILFNREALVFILQNYPALEVCQKKRQKQETCESLAWPDHAVFIKTSWRRSEDGFAVERFATDPLSLVEQWQGSSWKVSASGEPAATETFALRTTAGQKFHLVGMHASLRIEGEWFWTSLWNGPTPLEDLAADQPAAFTAPWTHYRLCSLYGWSRPLLKQTIGPDWPPAIAGLAQSIQGHATADWCSNPYLELGTNNHKTNCIGCHQFAGNTWTRADFTRRLTSTPDELISRSPLPGSADFVWSLFAGPEPLIQPLMDSIEYFDVYDPY